MSADVCELLMVICFGLAWPVSFFKALKSKSAKGTSILFECLALAGYGFGIAWEFALYSAAQKAGTPLNVIFYVGWFLMILDLVWILADIIVWIRNSILDKKRDSQDCKEKAEKQDVIDRLTAEVERLTNEISQKMNGEPAAAEEMPSAETE